MAGADGQDEVAGAAETRRPAVGLAWAFAQAIIGVGLLGVWLVFSFIWWNNLFLAPLGCVLVAGLAFARIRGARVGGLLACAVVGTAWSVMVVGSIWVWGQRNPAPKVGPPPPGELSVDQQINVDRAEREFFEVAYREPDLDRYRHHVVGAPGIEQLAGCWSGTAVQASSSLREVKIRDSAQPSAAAVVDLSYNIAGQAHRARLNVAADGWQVVELDRVPGFEHCPMGFPVPSGRHR